MALPLDVLDLVVEELHEYGDDGEAANDGAVVRLPRQDVQRRHRPLDDLLHAHAVRIRTARLLSVLQSAFTSETSRSRPVFKFHFGDGGSPEMP